MGAPASTRFPLACRLPVSEKEMLPPVILMALTVAAPFFWNARVEAPIIVRSPVAFNVPLSAKLIADELAIETLAALAVPIVPIANVLLLSERSNGWLLKLPLI